MCHDSPSHYDTLFNHITYAYRREGGEFSCRITHYIIYFDLWIGLFSLLFQRHYELKVVEY